MEFNDDAKQRILELLKSGRRVEAIQFIQSNFNTSLEDAQRLLQAFELQFKDIIGNAPPQQAQTVQASGCGGCFGIGLKMASILTGFLALVFLAVGYFLTEVIPNGFGDNLKPVRVGGMVYSGEDSSHVYLIFEYTEDHRIQIDTSTVEYPANLYHVGDSIRVAQSELSNTLGNEPIRDIQKIAYGIGAGLFVLAVALWIFSNSVTPKSPLKTNSPYLK